VASMVALLALPAAWGPSASPLAAPHALLCLRQAFDKSPPPSPPRSLDSAAHAPPGSNPLPLLLPCGTSTLRARVPPPPDAEARGSRAGAAATARVASPPSGAAPAPPPGGAELLCMSRPLYELVAGGGGRSVPPSVLPVLARHVDWLAGSGVDLLVRRAGGVYPVMLGGGG
jgi:hypothetical protein